MKMQFKSESIEQTDAFGEVFAGLLVAGDVVLLDGELGSGKTTLVRSIASAMGVEEGLVSSPTFVTINEYPWANLFNHEPKRRRRLLLHRSEINKLDIKVSQKGYTLVPLCMYVKNGKIKVEVGVARGKRQS